VRHQLICARLLVRSAPSTGVGALRTLPAEWLAKGVSDSYATICAGGNQGRIAGRCKGLMRVGFLSKGRLREWHNSGGGAGRNDDDEEGVALRATAAPWFGRGRWLKAVGVLTAVASGIAAYRLWARGIEARSQELERQVKERTAEIQRRREVAEGLREILVILNSERSLEESLDYIVSQAARLTGAEGAVIFRPDEAEIGAAITMDDPGGREGIALGDWPPMPEWITGPILQGHSLTVRDLDSYQAAHPEATLPTPGEYHAVLGLPLSAGGVIHGGLVLFDADEASMSEEDLVLASSLADQAALAIANAQLRDRAKEMAAAAERSRLARELHDAVTQMLFSASLIAEVLPDLWESDADEGRQLLQELRQLNRGALAEMRGLLLELRPSALVEAELGGLLQQLAETVTGRAGVPVRVVVEGQRQLPAEVHVGLYRIAQEALNNVAKHARATQATVRLRCCPGDGGEGRGRVELCISDDGVGFDPDSVSSDRLGLGSMRERAQLLGANLRIESKPGYGTRVTVAWQG